VHPIHVSGLCKRFHFPAIPKQATLKDLVVRRIRVEGQTSVVDALDDVSFEVERGQALGVIGRNGSGKTTLLRILAGIMKADRGEVRLDGSVAPLLSLGTSFHPMLSGRENAYVELLVLGLSRARARELLDDAIAFSELEEFIDAPMRTYSAGMSMRLAFSVAACIEPDILLIDEILAVGDEAFADKCMRRMHDLKRRGATIVLVTHSAQTVEAECERALWLDAGRVAAYGAAGPVTKAYHEAMSTRAAS